MPSFNSWIITHIGFLITMSLFIWVFVTRNLPEIKDRSFQQTNCRATNTSVVPRYCCNYNCDTNRCSTAPAGSPGCGDLQNQAQSLNPAMCPANPLSPTTPNPNCAPSGSNASCSQTCTGSGSSQSCSTSCTSYQCNCYCASGTNNIDCSLTCSQCYTVVMNVTYALQALGSSGARENATISTDFGTDLSGANNFVNQYAVVDVGTGFTCFYDPNDYSKVLISIDFTTTPWVYFGLVSILFYAFIMAETFLSLETFLEAFVTLKGPLTAFDIAWMATMSFWVGVVLPFAILIPVAVVGRISESSRMGCVCSALVVTSLANAPVAVYFLQRAVGRNAAMAVYAVGAVLPLCIYLPILLYVRFLEILVLWAVHVVVAVGYVVKVVFDEKRRQAKMTRRPVGVDAFGQSVPLDQMFPPEYTSVEAEEGVVGGDPAVAFHKSS
ncbi:hypothetical protein HDU98_006230 [Podochytrium sp. JEL0797]|nr:hypothetical protein HDU98_006230 [Podochytrium sp. JEL0797]